MGRGGDDDDDMNMVTTTTIQLPRPPQQNHLQLPWQTAMSISLVRRSKQQSTDDRGEETATITQRPMRDGGGEIQQSASRWGKGDSGWGSGGNNDDGRHDAAANNGLRHNDGGQWVQLRGISGLW